MGGYMARGRIIYTYTFTCDEFCDRVRVICRMYILSSVRVYVPYAVCACVVQYEYG